jgi:hypothetical protein
MLASVLTDVKFINVGDDLDSYAVAFLAYGLTIDNDTGNWLFVNKTWHIPPWTYGWSQPLPGTKAISVEIEAGSVIIPSVNVGTFVRLFITASQVPQSNGYTAVTSTSITSGTVTISGSITVGTITAGNVNVNPGTFTLGGQGDASIGVTGTAFQLSTTSVPTQVVMLKARTGNAGIVYVGKSNVTNTQSTAGNRSTTAGFQLDPGDMIVFPATNLNAIFINGTAGDGVSYEYWT